MIAVNRPRAMSTSTASSATTAVSPAPYALVRRPRPGGERHIRGLLVGGVQWQVWTRPPPGSWPLRLRTGGEGRAGTGEWASILGPVLGVDVRDT